MASPLISPGTATSTRAAFDLELTTTMLDAVTRFTRAVRASALAAAVISAPGTFTLGEVLGAWAPVVDDVTTLLAASGLDDAYVAAARSRLLAVDLPAEVYDSARAVLTYAAEQRWSRRRLEDELSAAVDPETPFVELGLTAAVELAAKAGRSAVSIARMIARTEATAAYGYAAVKVMAAFGRPQKKWISRHDSKTRPTHLAVDGQVIGIAESFVVGGAALLYPGDPSAPPEEVDNCRCVLVAVGKATLQPIDLLETLGPKPSSALRELIRGV